MNKEKCEGGMPECGPVVAHDDQGVPLCAECARELAAAGSGPPYLGIYSPEGPHESAQIVGTRAGILARPTLTPDTAGRWQGLSKCGGIE